MKLTKTKLKQIVKEEIEKVLSEYAGEYDQYARATSGEVPTSGERTQQMLDADASEKAALEQCKEVWGPKIEKIYRTEIHGMQTGYPEGWNLSAAIDKLEDGAKNQKCSEYVNNRLANLRKDISSHSQWYE